jgi:hypothetical protein
VPLVLCPRTLNNPLHGAPLPSRRLAALNLEEPVVLDFGARAQDFLKRITPLSADLAGHGRTRTVALEKLHRICLAEVRTLKARYTLATVKLALSKYRNAIRAVDPDHLVLRPRKMRSRQRFSYLALDPEETRSLNAAYHERIHRDQSNLIPLDHPKGSRTPGQRPLPPKRHGPHGLTVRRPAEIFFSASFSLPRQKLPYPALLFDGQLKTRQAPGTSFEPYLIPVLANPRKLLQALDTLRSLKSFPSTKAVNTTTGPNSQSSFPPPSAPSIYPGNQDTSALPAARVLQFIQYYIYNIYYELWPPFSQSESGSHKLLWNGICVSTSPGRL